MVCFLNEFISINNYMTSVDVLKLAFKYIYSTFLKESSYNLVSKDFHLNCVYVVFRYLFNKYKFFSYSNFRLIISLPVYTQRLLVLLFGTFRVIASNSDRGQTGMTSEALGVSVAPSFFQSCVSDGKNARMEDVLRFKVRITNFVFILFILFSCT